MSITFEGVDASNKFSRIESYGGRLTENLCQATARDLLAEAMWRMEKAGLDIVGHVHDEVILEVPVGSITVDDVCTIMGQNPEWADGAPLAAAGYRGAYYFKD
jgi:DNA polymerase